ncbi:MAG: hypothetical protein GY771_05210, partial [bacterium]|nr:hypothetical protein [bacterium]
PVVLAYSTYLGGTVDYSIAYDVAVDAAGFVYVTGSAAATDFPTINSYVTGASGGAAHHGGDSDAFITGFSAAGDSLVYSSFFGGADSDWGTGIDLDSAGRAYIIGTTLSNLPCVNGYSCSRLGERDLFIVRFSVAGDELEYGTYFGGSDWEGSGSIAVDASLNVYITGETESIDFPLRSQIYGYTGAAYNAFAAKLNT